ncbi:RsmB/NOP family class I SAM-dependent RNA methyltransferase [Sphingomonas sp. BN140010]|uniref:RsmB/NOP family class I SAM-dependent RNA methyltransferase n=1 Tax=Sphingomonas arvum TaxID=2992113 RepID=A0ABT3JFC8_9SPHN|nr:RsmB/NOP family class I SAM-dependent RNA methyltransferase [Sphingomonas sp. BN140010]MCW3797772.1 RsmB/NOP family class I SAM-dependent RNA methyltransferase [Sphingomonas sp. BN140010]
MKSGKPRGADDGSGSRRAALQLLDAVLRRGQTLDAAAQRFTGPDRALALAIAGETIRRLREIDGLIDSVTRLRLADDAKARMVLRLALAQKLALHVPDHAIVTTALPLVEGGPRRLVHGVLGTLLRRNPTPSEASALPAAVEHRWTLAWGDQVVAAARRAIVRRPPLDLSFVDPAEAADYAAGNGGVQLAERHVRLSGGPAVTDLPGFGEGRWWVQDLAASLPARLIPPTAERVLDLCAAPGGKTMQLAAAGHQVTALDRSASRLARLSDNLARTGLRAETVVADAAEWNGGGFDAILLDAPCSATGTFRRHPEVLYRASPRIVAESTELQARLLAHAASLLRPGGVLVYAVCSLEPEEGEQIVAAQTMLEPDPPTGEVIPGIMPASTGELRLLPGTLEEQGGLDGFFIARLVRR